MLGPRPHGDHNGVYDIGEAGSDEDSVIPPQQSEHWQVPQHVPVYYLPMDYGAVALWIFALLNPFRCFTA